MVLPKSTDVTLDVKDFLSEQEYDRKKAGIISRVVGAPIKVEYQRDINCAYEFGEGYKIVKAKPKLKGIDGNTAMNHELAHVLFESFDPKAISTIKDWSFQWGAPKSPEYLKAFQVYHTAMNVIEDQRIESLWGKIYLGNFRDFVRVRKKLGKALEFIDHPSAVLLAERFYRPDLVTPSKYAEVGQFIHDVEGKDLKATMIVLKRIKPYLDEKIKEQISDLEKYREVNAGYAEKARQLSDCTEPEKREQLLKERDNKYEEVKKQSKKIHSNDKVNSVETRQEPHVDLEDDKVYSNYDDEELGTNNYEDALNESSDSAGNKLEQIKQSMEGSDSIKKPVYIREKAIQKGQAFAPKVDGKVVANLKRLLRTFKEKTHDEVSDEGYDLDIGEYINMKANGYGDCFIEDKETNGLSIVLSIDGSGSMASHNGMVTNMVQTIHEATKGEKQIEIRTIVWSSDRMGNVALQRYKSDEIKYLPYQRGGYTPTHFGIEEGSRELSKMNGRRKLLIVITDGFPNYHNNGVKVRTDATASATIKAYKKALRATPNISVIGVGMLLSNTYMRNMFGNKYIACKTMNEVGSFINTTLRKEIIRVMKR